ncbi:MAG: hypothetical protein Q7W56_02920 [Candidatus Latescibacteria bacterium]|nr:hypothetical protein [Candidatus Latescibacterota bacterium]
MQKTSLCSGGAVALAAVLLLTGCAGTSPDLRGTWVLVSAGGHQFPAVETAGPGDIVKILTDDAFATTGRAAGKFEGGAGDWSYRDGVYTECIRVHSNEDLIGQKISFRCRVEGDFWHHAAEFVAGGRRHFIDEVWRRLASGKCAAAPAASASVAE